MRFKVFRSEDITANALARRLFVSAFCVLLAVILLLIAGVNSSFKSVRAGELDVVLTAIESGPVQFARYHSGDLANRSLAQLFENSGLATGYFLTAEIISGGVNPRVFATWRRATSPAQSCVASQQRDVKFDEAFEPFRVLLTYDRCQAIPAQKQIGLVIASVVLLALIILVVCFWVALKPVASSLAEAGRVFDVGSNAKTGIGLVRYLPLRKLALKALESKELEKHAAVASMTGMLAHDVRKPFSILRMGLGMLGKAQDPAAVKRILAGLVPEIDKAVSSVDGLIADVMEVGSTSTQLIQEPASPESLIEATLGEAFRIYPKADISIEYDLRHTHMVNVHVQKVGRVFSNIVGNAIQAMGYKGDIWFKTRERDGLIEFCLGNAGSVIPADSLPKLFDAFFTSGKKGGTGLGLAISQKVVTAHGGRIWCDSSRTMEHPNGKVEFFFTLPISEGAKNKTTATLPKHSSDITKAIAAMAAAAEAGEGSVDKGELTLEVDIIQASDKLGRALRVLVIDDEAVYRDGLVAYLSRTPELESAIVLAQADGSEAALSAVGAEGFDLIISDVDMGHDSLDGFALVRKLRAGGHAGMICVHSNRIVAADHKRAIEAGADAFLPKPMARAQLLRLVLQAVQSASVPFVEPAIESIVPRQGAVAADKPLPKPEILVVDDNPFILDAWEDVLKADAIVHVFTGLEDLSDRLEADPGFADRLVAAITDMHLDGSAGDGLDVGRLLKKSRPGLPVLLSSDGVFQAGELTGAVDKTIGKDPVDLGVLQSLLNNW